MIPAQQKNITPSQPGILQMNRNKQVLFPWNGNCDLLHVRIEVYAAGILPHPAICQMKIPGENRGIQRVQRAGAGGRLGISVAALNFEFLLRSERCLYFRPIHVSEIGIAESR